MHLFGKFYWTILDQKHISPAINILAYHEIFKEGCKEKHPDVDPARCALVYTTVQKHMYMDKFWPTYAHNTTFNADKVYWSFNNGMEGAMHTEWLLKRVNDGLLIAGLMLHLMGV